MYRAQVLGTLVGQAKTITVDTTSKEEVFSTMNKQPVEGYYHFEDIDFSPYCDSISYGYNCGPCLDSHVDELLDDHWRSIGNERYVNFKEWVLKSRYHGQVIFYLKTISIYRSPDEEICGRLILHATPWSRAERKQLRRKEQLGP